MERFILKELSRYPIGTYGDIIYRNALLYPDNLAFVYKEDRVSFLKFNERVNGIIHALKSIGIKKGDGIGVIAWNCLAACDVVGAAMKGGFIASPFNPRLQEAELEYIINYSEARVLFVGPEFLEVIEKLRPKLKYISHCFSIEGERDGFYEYDSIFKDFPSYEPEVEITEDDPFIIFYTSGTTGLPRGAVYTHYRKLEESRTKALTVGINRFNKHVMILPLFHIGGWSHFWTFFCVGGSNIIMAQRSFDPAATLKTIQEERATDIHIVPTQLVGMLALPDIDRYDLTSLKRIWYAASPMPFELLRRGIERFGPIFAQGYGQSESGPDISILKEEYHNVLDKSPEEQKILTSCGQPCLWVHARIVDEKNDDLPPFEVGEIVVQSKSIMKEYWKRPEDTEMVMSGGWLHTGDMGYYDERGFIYIVDRKKDMIITGGENVYPREVEEVLYGHPAVSEAAVIGVPDEKWVERVHAVVVLKEGFKVSGDEIIDFCKSRLARYKAPRSIEFVEALPKNPQGKILKREIRDKYWKGKERKI
ncbi:MAG: long-chain-fatty-acid--CoA ligase [Syntrophorhabdaceae bacterium]|nr:long-chain-fatty-acid--CoA ligase [Syntrophorhabdaceae bacterium]